MLLDNNLNKREKLKKISRNVFTDKSNLIEIINNLCNCLDETESHNDELLRQNSYLQEIINNLQKINKNSTRSARFNMKHNNTNIDPMPKTVIDMVNLTKNTIQNCNNDVQNEKKKHKITKNILIETQKDVECCFNNIKKLENEYNDYRKNCEELINNLETKLKNETNLLLSSEKKIYNQYISYQIEKDTEKKKIRDLENTVDELKNLIDKLETKLKDNKEDYNNMKLQYDRKNHNLWISLLKEMKKNEKLLIIDDYDLLPDIGDNESESI